MKKALSFIVSVITMLSFSLTACTATNTKTEVKTNTSTAKQINDNFILINSGTFQMGSPTNESERESDEIQHKVMVNSFYMSKTELSQKEYKDVMENNPSESKGDTLPVENVTWYKSANCYNAYGYNNNASGSWINGYLEHTVNVNSYVANAYELYNIHGNVAEWVWDWYSDYNTSV